MQRRKKCNKCCKRLSVSNFHRYRKAPDGLQYSCIKCNRIRISETAYKRILRGFGLTIKDYERMLEAQNRVCAICCRPQSGQCHGSGLPRRLSIDHDHATGIVRGLLCTHCNNVLGHARDDTAILKKAIAYLKKHREVSPL